MKRPVRQLFIFNQDEKRVLERLSEARQVSQSELVRVLLRDAAIQAGLWPTPRLEVKTNGKK